MTPTIATRRFTIRVYRCVNRYAGPIVGTRHSKGSIAWREGEWAGLVEQGAEGWGRWEERESNLRKHLRARGREGGEIR